MNPTLKQASGIVIIVVCVLGLLLSNIMVCLIFWFRDLKPILISSPLFCYIQLAGISMAYISMTLYVDKPNPAKCIARQILLYGGFSLVIGSIIAKNYRYLHCSHSTKKAILTKYFIIGFIECKITFTTKFSLSNMLKIVFRMSLLFVPQS